MAKHARRTGRLFVLRVFSAALVGVGLALGGWLGWFYLHDSLGGSALLSQARAGIAASGHQGAANTKAATDDCKPAKGAVGELVIPRLSLVAPIVQGDGDAQLSDAVGHVPSSVWPGDAGTTVFVAHDVTWFHDIDRLTTGADVEYVSGCRAITYRVQSTEVVAEGSPVANTPGHLVLVTCWPLDALWFTSQRYLVQADEVGGTTTVTPVSITTTPAVPSLAVPQALASVDTLTNNPTPLGTLSVRGSPTKTFKESPGPLSDAAAAQDVFYAAQRAAEADDAAQWSVVAPGVTQRAAVALAGNFVRSFGASLSTSLEVAGEHLLGATLGVQEVLSSGEEWTITVTEGIVGGKLAVTGWSMVPT